MCGHYLINICVTTINIDLFIYLNGQKVWKVHQRIQAQIIREILWMPVR